MVREAIYSRYEYPNLKSRLKTYLLKAIRPPLLYKRHLYFPSFYAGEVWNFLVDIKIGEDNSFNYFLEILQAEWCKQIEILIIRDLKEL